LAFYPGDLYVSLLHARALLQEENSLSLKQALHILEELCASDPEFLLARMELTQAKILSGLDTVTDSIGYEIGLGKRPGSHRSGYFKKIPKWARDLHEARKYLSKINSVDEKTIKSAEQTIHHVITQDFNNPLIAVTHIKILNLNNSLSGLGMLSLAEAYHNRWLKCIQFILYLADSYMAIGDSDQAVSLLHKAVSADISGQVAKRQWGENHPYKSLWPQLIEIKNNGTNTPQNIPIPASVANAMGWNQLPESIHLSETGKYPDQELVKDSQKLSDSSAHPREQSGYPTSHDPGTDENNRKDFIREAWKDFHALTSKIRQPDLSNMDGRFPIYVVFTTKIGLEAKYGSENANVILEELGGLVKVLRGSRISHRKWGSILFCPDDADNISSFGLKPVPHNDPWGLKLSLSDLDDTLGRRGEMIGAVLIIGGPEVVPFHHLPNPVDDDDPDVPSDNPYATLDENYFVQEWPIGRLPGSVDSDASILLGLIQVIKGRYITRKRSIPWYRRIWNVFIDAIWPPYRNIQPSLGYTAAVWQRASISVFRTIGQPRSLLISPPIKSCDPFQRNEKDKLGNSTCITLNPSTFAYFNLHGLQDSAEWYGQSDPVDIRDYPDFPIALRPQDITNGGRAPKVVFSEACYGAHITGKRLEEAIALKFLVSGSQCVIGSSCISYGSIRTPLIGADLLGHAFWKYLTDGMTTGEALRWSKIYLIKEMNKRQGFLDGEDQKTLISFVLYGDPLSQPYKSDRISKLSSRSVSSHGSIKTVCARIDNTTEPSPVPDEFMTNVKHVVSHYLPGMKDANVSIGTERTGCQNACRNCLSGNLCPTAQLTPKKVGNLYSDRRVITLSKSIQKGKTDHKKFAHITLDPNGKVLKLAVSR
jgi:hypothetical protein